jgi:hypothetical protein
MAVIERPLSDSELDFLRPYFLAPTLELARIVEGGVPFWLRPKMCAVVLGHRIYFRTELDRPRAYQENTASGIELLAHELTHVEQYFSGMTILKYLWASRFGYNNNAYEIEAYAKGAVVRAHWVSKSLI